MGMFRLQAGGQRGVATVFISVVLLLAVGLIALYTSRSAIVEQRLSANEVRAKQALAAANAGIEHALAYMRNGGLDQDKNDVVDTIPANVLTSVDGTPSSYRVVYVSSAGALPDCPATPAFPAGGAAVTVLTEVAAVSCGWSDDNGSVQRVVQRLTATPSLGGNISTPLVAHGGVTINGNPSVFNFFNDLTVWSGAPMDSGSAPGKTFVRNLVENPNADTSMPYRDVGDGNNVPSHYQESTTKGEKIGHDVVAGDTNLGDMDKSTFFKYFLGLSPDVYRDTVANVVVSAANVGSIVGMNNSVIWVNGDVSLPGNIGTPTKPVVLVINGDLTMNATPVVYGLVFVMGNITSVGSPTIYGGLIGAGTVGGAGAASIVYDPAALGLAESLGKAAKLPGTWRDW